MSSLRFSLAPATNPTLDPEVEQALVAGFATARSTCRLARAFDTVLAGIGRPARHAIQ